MNTIHCTFGGRAIIVHPLARAELAGFGPGARVAAGARIYHAIVGAYCVIGRDAVVRDAVLYGRVRIGHGTEVREASIGRGAVIGERCRIEGHVGTGAIVGPGVVHNGGIIGAHARIGAGAYLHEDVIVFDRVYIPPRVVIPRGWHVTRADARQLRPAVCVSVPSRPITATVIEEEWAHK